MQRGVGRMRSIRSYNIKKTTYEKLNAHIPRGYRSDFVDKAIVGRIDGYKAFDLYDISTLRLASHLRLRFGELTEIEKAVLADLISRLSK